MKIKIFTVSILMLTVFITNSCVKDEIAIISASINSITISPTTPQSTEQVQIIAEIKDLKKSITTAKLFYKPSTVSTFTSLDMTVGKSDMYSAIIPAFAKDTKVEYYIQVVNSDNLITLSPATAPATLSSYTVGASTEIKLFVNEVYANGDATNSDWIEIYNDSEIEVDLSGYSVYDDGIKTGLKEKRVLKSGIKIAPKGFLVLNADIDPDETIKFGLSTTADAVYLENTSNIVVSQLAWDVTILGGTDLKSGKSFGRKPDGSSTMVVFANPTKGTSNNNAN